MVFRKKARRVFGYGRAKVRSFRRKHSAMSGVMGSVVAGAVVGGVTQFAAPYINQYVPRIGSARPTSIALAGVGLADKLAFHKGGKFTDAALVMGSAMLVGDMLAGMGTGAPAGNSGVAYG